MYRYVRASMSVGACSSRARSTARTVVSCTASTSIPSTISSAMSYEHARRYTSHTAAARSSAVPIP